MKQKVSLICKLFVAVMTPAVWLIGAVHPDPNALLVVHGLGNLKFFTVLSNLFNGLTALLCILLPLLHRASSGKGLRRLKLAAAAAVALTFLIVLAFLGPLYEHRHMYTGSNLWYHLLLPLITMLDFCLLDPDPVPSRKDTLWAGLPALLYGLGYTANLLINGVGVWPDTNDFYGFLNWGWGAGLCIFAGIVLLSWLLALLLRTGKCAAQK